VSAGVCEGGGIRPPPRERVSRAAAEGRRAECVCEAESELESVPQVLVFVHSHKDCAKTARVIYTSISIFGVLFLSCVCVSVSGVLFSVGVCVCDLLILFIFSHSSIPNSFSGDIYLYIYSYP